MLNVIDGDPQLTRRAIGQWLEYSDPQKAVDKIVERNQRVEQFSVPVNLTATDGTLYQNKVYNPIGFQLIVVESGQRKAKRYKVAVAKLMWAYMKGELKPSGEAGYASVGVTQVAEGLERCTDGFSEAVDRLTGVLE